RDEYGTLHECSALCTRMRAVVRWNPLESSCDCPCHGSRFSPTGEVIMGPASSRLEYADCVRASRSTGQRLPHMEKDDDVPRCTGVPARVFLREPELRDQGDGQGPVALRF